MKILPAQTRLLLIVIGITLSCSASSFGAASDIRSPPKFEIWTGNLASLSAATAAQTDIFGFNFLGNGIGAGLITGVLLPSVGYFIIPQLELVLGINVNYSDRRTFPRPTLTSIYKIMGGALFNFSNDIARSFYLRADAGVAILAFGGENSATDFALAAQLGKRYQLTDQITYAPNLSFEWIDTAPEITMSLAIVPLQFSVLFDVN